MEASHDNVGPSAVARVCAESGLPITRRPEWSYDPPSGDYSVRFYLLGERIVFAQPSGLITPEEIKAGFRMMERVVDSLSLADTGFVLVEDYRYIRDVTRPAKDDYIRYMKQYARPLIGHIFLGVPLLLKMSLNLARRMHVVGWPIETAATYEEAVTKALAMAGEERDPIAAGKPGCENPTCPCSGLPVTMRDEWTDIPLGNGYSVSFRIIGERILHSHSEGGQHADRKGIQELFARRSQVLNAVLPEEGPFVELRDYTDFQRMSSWEARSQFIKEMRRGQDRQIAFVGYNAPLSVKLGIRVGARFYNSPFPVAVADSYETAVMKAEAFIREYGNWPDTRIARDEWVVRAETMTIRLEIRRSSILHAVVEGRLREAHVDQLFEIQNRMAADMGFDRKPFVIAVNMNGVTGATRKARRRYIAEIKAFHARFPVAAYYLYGINTATRAIISVSRLFVPFRVVVTDSYEAILNQMGRGVESPRTLQPPSDGTYSQQQIERYVDELLHFVGSMNWSPETGEPEGPATDADSPLRPVFDAIELVQQDVLDLFEERRQAERDRVQFSAVINQAADIIIITDVSGIIQHVNPAFEETTGFDRREVVGRHITEFDGEKKDTAFVRKILVAVLRKGMWRGRLRKQKKDGTFYEVETKLSPVRDENNVIVNFAFVCRDVTHEVELEKRLDQAQKMEAIGNLAGGIAHDFNNILFPIVGYAEMMMEDAADDADTRDGLEQILLATKRARDLIQQILTFSRQTGYDPKPLKIQLVVREVLKLIRSSLPSTIAVHHNISPDCGMVFADATQIHQIVMNLCTNAYHAMEENGGELTVNIRETGLASGDLNDPDVKAGRYVCLTVADSGQGMDQVVMGRIFDPYFTTKDKNKGTGLGLAVIHGIVKSHHGYITVASEPGQGAEFNIYLPLIPEFASGGQRKTVLPVRRGTEHILLVDDEQPVLQMVANMLQRLGYQVTDRSSSVDALAAFRANPERFDLVVSDMTMPNMTGDKLAREILAIRPKMPIVICTGFSEAVNEETALEMGIRSFLMKPVVQSDLSHAIREALETPRVS